MLQASIEQFFGGLEPKPVSLEISSRKFQIPGLQKSRDIQTL